LLIGWFLVCVGVFAIVPGYYLVEKFRHRAAWKAYETEARGRGVKLERADYLLPPPIPDAENFARIPLFEEAFRAAEAEEEFVDPFVLEPGSIDAPNLADPSQKEPVDLAAWQVYCVETKHLSNVVENPATGVLKALEGFTTPLDQLQAASRRPRCRFPSRQGFAETMPHWMIVYSAARLHALRIAAHLELGQSPAAYEDFQAILRLAAVTREEPTLTAGLSRTACLATAANAVWDGLARQKWAAAELRKIETDLAAIDGLAIYVHALASERADRNTVMATAIQDPGKLSGIVGEYGSRSTAWANWFYPTGWLERSRLRWNRYTDELLARVDPAQHRWHSERPTPSSPTNLKESFDERQEELFLLLAPVLESNEKRFLLAATLLDQARIACALERFRQARGVFPKTLSELAPEYLANVPREIVTDAAYQYRRTDDGGYRLYSIGVDLRDDHGVIDSEARFSWEQRDWVWSLPGRK
jgi:hypothetical protein